MVLHVTGIILGLALLLYSADRFITGSSSLARHMGLPPMIIGMVVVGFGTSAPELIVSTIGALEGTPGIALGNAYGSNIANIGLILGLTALVRPLAVHSRVVRREIPLLALATAGSAALMLDGRVARWDAAFLLLAFAALVGWTLAVGSKAMADPLAQDAQQEAAVHAVPLRRALFWVIAGLLLLLVSSRLLVWAATEIARSLGMADLVIGLTVVAVGTSLPELASSVAAARRGEDDLAVGNIVGSNLFNTLAVVGVAGAITPMQVPGEFVVRDLPTTGVFTLLLLCFGSGWRRAGRLNRVEGAVLVSVYAAYGLVLAAVAS